MTVPEVDTETVRPPAAEQASRPAQVARSKPRRFGRDSLVTAAKAVAGIAGLFVVWELLVVIFDPPEFLLVGPVSAFAELIERPEYFATNTFVTLQEALAGFALGTALGVLCGAALHYSATIRSFLYPALVAIDTIPKVALAPLFIVWLGFGPSPKILVAVLMAFFPIVISGLAGMRSVDPEILELTSTMGASRFKTFAKIRLPASLPQLMSGLKVAATLAVTGAVVGEFVGANEGLGYVILQANGNIDTAMLFAALIIMSALGIVLFAIIEIAEKLLIPWHSSRRVVNSATA